MSSKKRNLIEPEPTVLNNFKPTNVDNDFARRFRLLARTIDGCSRSEHVLLLLSTCRNAFLLVNAVFVDCSRALGRSSKGPLLHLALHQLREGRTKYAQRAADEAIIALRAGRTKLRVWSDRVALNAEFEAALPVDPIERSDVVNIVHGVASPLKNSRGAEWTTRFHEFRIDDEPELSSALEFLSDVIDDLLPVARLIRALSETGNTAPDANVASPLDGVETELRLFDSEIPHEEDDEEDEVERTDDPADQRPAWLQALVRCEKALRIRAEAVDGITVEVIATVGPSFSVPLSDPHTSQDLLAALQKYLDEAMRQLEEMFRPNVGDAPMPPPFVIDLHPGRVVSIPNWTSLRVSFVTGGVTIRPAEIKVALVIYPVPWTFFSDGKYFELGADPKIARSLREVIFGGIEVASHNGAQAIVFPEYSIPRAFRTEIAQLANERSIVVIGGLDARTIDGKYAVELLVHVPGMGSFLQPKQRPSVYEPVGDAFHRTNELLLFESTPIGNFATLSCSDYLENDIMAVLARRGQNLDLLIVPSHNPQWRLYAAAAASDAVRLYCDVVVVNTWDAASKDVSVFVSEGTTFATPEYPDLLEARRKKALEYEPQVGAEELGARIRIVTLPIAAVASSRVDWKPDTGFINPPFQRRGSPAGRQSEK